MPLIAPAIQKPRRRIRAVVAVLIGLVVATLGLSITSTPAFAGTNGQQLQLYFPPKFHVHHVSVKGTNNYDDPEANTNFDYSPEYGWHMPGWYWKNRVTATVTLTYENDTFTQDVEIIVQKAQEAFWLLPGHRKDWNITAVDFFYPPAARILSQAHFSADISAHTQPRTITELAAYFD